MSRIVVLFIFLCFFSRINAQSPLISSFTPSSGPVGTLITINGQNLTNGNVKILNQNAITISSGPSKMVAMVMPGSGTGSVSVSNGKGTTTSASKFTVLPTAYPSVQQGPKLLGTDGIGQAEQGGAVAISADGNTVAIGGENDHNFFGAVWVFTRSGGTWTQQGDKIIPPDAKFNISKQLAFGSSVALSADGNTLLIGALEDSQNGDGTGAAWIYVRENGMWKEQTKVVGTGNFGASTQGADVALSADGNTALVYGTGDNFQRSATWVFTRTGNAWTQQGQKLVPAGMPNSTQYTSSAMHSPVALSADGNTILMSVQVSPSVSSQCVGVFFTRNNGVWTEQSGRLQVTDGLQGKSIALSADGNTAMVGGPFDDQQKSGAWIFVKNGNNWVQQGPKLIGPAADAQSLEGTTMALSADGNTAVLGSWGFGVYYRGGIWVFTRNNGTWSLQGSELTGYDTDQSSLLGVSVAISADGATAIGGGLSTNDMQGGAWIFSTPPPAPPTAVTLPATELTYSGATLNGTAADNGSITAVSFEYSTSPDLAGAIAATVTTGTNPINAGSGQTSFSSVLTSLQPLTTYYFRIDATNDGGTSHGDVLSFTTPARSASLPVVKTEPATVVTSTTVTLNGTADDGGSPTTVSFEIGLSPTLSDAVPASVTSGTTPMAANTGQADFAAALTGLSPNTTYYFRIKASNAVGMVNGDILSFTTTAKIQGLSSLGIPNAFTPNNDGVNDKWEIKSLSAYPNCSVKIFNRYGTNVYNSTGYNIPWDGTYKGSIVPAGIYYYIIDHLTGSGPVAGYVMLIR